ncbi:MAG: leucine-rich repeat protein [Lachnospiraceae bacterium]|nr:leucine-rich repeat protein [Lachnospiraceae bacterium]
MVEKRVGACGAEVNWTFYPETGEMVISGNGPMTDYENYRETPWCSWRNEIRTVVFEPGVTTLGDYTFECCENLEEIRLTGDVDVLGTFALSKTPKLTEVVLPEGVRVIGAKTFSACTGLRKVHIPLSVKAMDMKAFEQNPGIEEVTYGGTREQWNQMRISMDACGNNFLLKAYGKSEDISLWDHFYGLSEEKIPLFETAKEIIQQGGDGRFHILTVQLTTMHVTGKPGDCTLLILPDGRTMMIDAGVKFSEDRVMNAVRALGLKTLDYFMTSHPHPDHVGNALAVAKYLFENGEGIGTYLYSGHVYKEQEPEFAAYIEAKGTVMDNHLTRGDVRQIGEVQMEVLRPTKQMLMDGVDLRGDDINTLSLTVKFTFGKVSYLTGGDLYRNDEREAVRTYGDHLKSTVLKACHHGVFTSSSDEWIDTISPEVILVNSDDIGGTVLSEKAARKGIGFYSSGLDGSVLVSMSRDGEIEVKTGYGKTFSKRV